MKLNQTFFKLNFAKEGNELRYIWLDLLEVRALIDIEEAGRDTRYEIAFKSLGDDDNFMLYNKKTFEFIADYLENSRFLIGNEINIR